MPNKQITQIQDEQVTLTQEKRVPKPNYSYLLSLTLTCALSSIQLGPVLSATNAALPELIARFDIDRTIQDEFFSMSTQVSSASIFGVTIGSLIGGTVISRSRRHSLLIFNLVVILGSILSVVDNFTVICIGRIVYGFAAGVLLAASPKVIEETVPANIQDYGFGASTNLTINIGIMISFAQGNLNSGDLEAQKTANLWRLIYLTPVPFSVLAIIMHLFVHKNESIDFHVERGQKDQAIIMLTKLYGKSCSEEEIDQIYIEKAAIKEQQQGKNTNKPNLAQVLTDPKYRASTMMCVMIAFVNQMCGVNIVNIYAAKIFQQILATGGTMFCSIETAGTFVGLSGFLGSFNAIFTTYFLSRRALFIGGHAFMMVFLFLTALFISLNQGNACLICICLYIISFQSTNGSALWVYSAEIGQDAAMGILIFVCMGLLFVQSLVAQPFVSWITIKGFFYFFGAFQVFTCSYLYLFMKETKGLSSEAKKRLYEPKGKEQEELEIQEMTKA